MSSPWPLRVVAVPPASCGVVLWRMQGVLRVTAIVKATFQLVHEKRAEIVHALDILRADALRTAEGSLAQAAEVAPYLPSAGVLLEGHACAPPDRPVTALTVRLALHRDRWILNKVLHVYGDRSRDAPNARPFRAIPIVYERAYGGASVPANPAGSGADGPVLPNIVDPSDPLRPAGFGPIAKHWAARRSLLAGGHEPDSAVLELDPSFDFRWFHAAPADQQVDFLRGDESLFLEGLHPQYPWFRSGLPSARALAQVYRMGHKGSGQGQTIDLSADTLTIDADHLLCSIIWRGHFVCSPNDSPANLVIMGGIELPGRPVAWPSPEAFAPPIEDLSSEVELVDEDRTAEIRVADLLAKRSRPPTPFATAEPGQTPGPPAARLSATPWGNVPIQPAPQPVDNLAVTQSAVHVMADPSRMHTVDLISPFAQGGGDASRVQLPKGPVLPFTAPEPAKASAAVATSPAEPPLVQHTPLPPPSSLRPPVGVPPPSSPRPPVAVPPPSTPQPPVAAAPPVAVPPPSSPRPPVPVAVPPPSSPRPPVPVAVPPPSSPRPPDILQSPGAAQNDEPEELLDVDPEPVSEPAPAIGEPPESEAKGVRAVVIARLKKGEPLHDLELAGAELGGVDFGGAVLDRRNLAGSSLVGCNLKGARLSGADLSGADLTGAILTQADLTGADLSRATLDRAELEGAILTEANLSFAKAHGARFDGASLEGADARKARLFESRLEGANLSRIAGRGADLSRSNLSRANLSGAILRAAKLKQTVLVSAKVDGADLRDADLTGAHVHGTSLAAAKTAGAILRDLVETPPAEPT